MRDSAGQESGAQGHPISPRHIAAMTVLLTLVASLPVNVAGPVSLPIRRDLILSSAHFGAMLASFAFGVATFAIPSGRLVERAGLRSGLRVALLLTALSALGAAASTGWLMLAASMYIGGVGAAVSDVALASWISQSVPPARQGVTLGLKHASVPTAAMLGGLAVPTVALTLGWRWVFIAVALLAAAAWPLTPRENQRRSRAIRSGRREPLPSHVCLLAASLAIGQMPLLFFSGFIVTEAVRSGIDEGPAGLLFAGCAACGIIARVGSGRAADRGRHRLVNVIVVHLVAGTGALALASVGSPISVTVAMLAGFMNLFAWQGLVALFVVRTTGTEVSRALSLLTLGGGTGILVGPVIFGTIYDHSPPWAWLTASAAPLMAAVGMVFSASPRRASRPPGPIGSREGTANEALPPEPHPS